MITKKKKTTLKAGSYTESPSSQNVPGINLQKLVVDKLIEENCMVSKNNHLFFPTFPKLGVDFTSITEVPVGGMYLAAGTFNLDYAADEDTTIYLKVAEGSIYPWLNTN